MKKGLTLIELLVVIAILGILSSVVMASFQDAKAKADSKNNTTQDHKLDQLAVAFKPENVEPTTDQICGSITNEDAKKQCEDYQYKNKMIQECIARYQ